MFQSVVRRFLLSLVAAAFALARLAHASTHTWTGATSNLWSVPGNWMEGTTPMGDASAALVFPASGTNAPANDLSSLTIQSITITGSPNNVSLSGNAITLNDGLTVDASVMSGFPSIDFAV